MSPGWTNSLQPFVPTKVISNRLTGPSITQTLPGPDLFQSLLFNREKVYRDTSIPPERKLTTTSADTTPAIATTVSVAPDESLDLRSITHAHKAEEKNPTVTGCDLKYLGSDPSRLVINHANRTQMGPNAVNKKTTAKSRSKSASVKSSPSRVAKRQPARPSARAKEVKKKSGDSSENKSERSAYTLIAHSDDELGSLFIPEGDTSPAQGKQVQELKSKVLELETKMREQEREVRGYEKTTREQKKIILDHEEQSRKQRDRFNEQTHTVHEYSSTIAQQEKRIHAQENREREQFKELKNLQAEVAQLVKENESLKTAAASTPSVLSPIPFLSSSFEDGKSENNIRQMYVRIKRRFDRLHKSAIDLKVSTQSMDLSKFGDFGQQLKQLKAVLEEDGRMMQDTVLRHQTRNQTPSLQ